MADEPSQMDRPTRPEALHRNALLALVLSLRNEVGLWQRAVALEYDRILDDPWISQEETKWIDALLFAVYLRTLLRVCRKMHDMLDPEMEGEPFKDLVDRFEEAIPNAHVIRDELESLDEGLVDFSPVFLTRDDPQTMDALEDPETMGASEGEISLHINDVCLDLTTGIKEAERLSAGAMDLLWGTLERCLREAAAEAFPQGAGFPLPTPSTGRA